MNENNQPQSQQTKLEPWGFCETPEEKCTMNYCDDNGCINRKRNLVSSHSPTEQPGDAKHTSGPWNLYSDNRGIGALQIDGDSHSQLVALVYGRDSNEQKANAELIARAPALLSEVSTLRSKQAELIDERNSLRYDLLHVTAERDTQASELDKLRNLIQEHIELDAWIYQKSSEMDMPRAIPIDEWVKKAKELLKL